MTPHRRRSLMKAILEVKGTLAGVTSEQLLMMSNEEVQALYDEIEKSLQDANTTEPAPAGEVK